MNEASQNPLQPQINEVSQFVTTPVEGGIASAQFLSLFHACPAHVGPSGELYEAAKQLLDLKNREVATAVSPDNLKRRIRYKALSPFGNEGLYYEELYVRDRVGSEPKLVSAQLIKLSPKAEEYFREDPRIIA